MEALNRIPQLFFDFIARLVPGAVAFFLLDIWSKENLWERLLRAVSVDKLDSDNVTALAFLTLSGVAYVLGQLLAPIGKLLGSLHLLPAMIKALWRRLRRKEAEQKSDDSMWLCYDWLRVHFPEAGALTAKIRAEYTMFHSLSAVFALATIAWLIQPVISRRWTILFFGLCIVAAYRGYECRRTFRASVTHLYRVAKSKDLEILPNPTQGGAGAGDGK